MKNDQKYIITLEQYIDSNSHHASSEDTFAFQELVLNQVGELLHAYLEKNYDSLEYQLQQQRKLRKSFTKIIKQQQSLLAYAGQFVQTFNIFNKLLHEKNQELSFSDEMQFVLQSYKNAESVLMYLYSHPHARHGEISENKSIPKSTLTGIFNVLEKVQCVTKVSSSKYSYYDLTVEGKTFIENLHPELKEEEYIDILLDYVEETMQQKKDVEMKLDFHNKTLPKKNDIKPEFEYSPKKRIPLRSHHAKMSRLFVSHADYDGYEKKYNDFNFQEVI